jgi:hypothetical protein
VLALVVGAAAPLLFPTGLWPFSTARARTVGLTREGYRNIEVGMGAAEVRQLLGEPDEVSGGDGSRWTYRNGNSSATVFLDAGGVVVGKSPWGSE